MALAWTIRREVDLARDFVGVERIAALATTSAKAAHELRIAVTNGGKTVDMDGASVLLNLILPDGISTTADGSIEAGACIAMLPPLCYQRGETRGVLLLQFGTQAAIPVYAFVLRCFEDLTDAFADPDHVIPSLAEILAQLDSAKAAVKAAQDGAGAANAAAGAADAAAGNATAAAQSANNAASAATKAAQAANAAAARLDGLTATATGLPASSAPTVNVTTGEDGAKRLAIGIPEGKKGDTGATPQLTVTAKTGEPGTEVGVVQGGTPENPTLEITIPRGETGHGVPEGGSKGQVLTVGDSGAVWADPTASVEVDATLTQEGQAADAKAVGYGLSQLKNDIGDAWASGKTYAVGDYAISGNQLYKCKTAHTAGSAFDESYWDTVNIASVVSEISNTIKDRDKYISILDFTYTVTDKTINIILPTRKNCAVYIIMGNSGSMYFSAILNVGYSAQVVSYKNANMFTNENTSIIRNNLIINADQIKETDVFTIKGIRFDIG